MSSAGSQERGDRGRWNYPSQATAAFEMVLLPGQGEQVPPGQATPPLQKFFLPPPIFIFCSPIYGILKQEKSEGYESCMKLLSRAYIAVADWNWRRKLHKTFRKMKSVGRNVHIRPGYMIFPPENVTIGDNVRIGDDFYARAEGGLTIGSGTVIARCTEIRTSGHNYNSSDLQKPAV